MTLTAGAVASCVGFERLVERAVLYGVERDSSALVNLVVARLDRIEEIAAGDPPGASGSAMIGDLARQGDAFRFKRFDRDGRLCISVRRLRALMRKAEVANVARSAFLAAMCHEIRTPMNGVTSMAQLLSQTRLDESRKMLNEGVIRSGEQILTVINDVLDMSKAGSGRMQLHPPVFPLERIACEPARMVARVAEMKKRELAVRLDTSLPSHVSGDLDRLGQVVVALVNNAVRFTEAGQLFIDVSGAVTEQSGAQAPSLAEPPEQSAAEPVSVSKRRIRIIDDDEANRKILREMVRASGAEEAWTAPARVA